MKKFILFFCAAFIATLGMFADSVTLKIEPSDKSVNMTGPNEAALFSLNDAEWSVVGIKNDANNNVGLNRDGTIRLYATNVLTVSNLKGKVITTVVLDVNKDNTGEGKVLVNDQEVAGVNNVYEIGKGEFALVNTGTSIWRLNSITINYETPGNPLVCSDVVDGGTYAIVNFQPTGAMYYLESVDGVLTAQNGEGIDGDTQWAATCQYKAIELEDGRFAFQNVATGDYLAWRSHQANGGIDGNRGFYGEINECTSWTMNDGTQVPDYRTYWFYAGNRSDTNKNSGTLILSNAGEWNAWSAAECTNNASFSNNFGFVAVPTEVDFTKVNISAINQADFVEAGKWYLLKQKRGVVSPVYDAGEGATMKRAANDNAVVEGMDAAEAVDYLLRFIPTENEGAYNLQFANGRYWANTMTTTSEEAGEYNVYNINGEAGHIGINKFNMENIVDNNGAGYTLAFWESGEVKELNGNNDWTVWEVEFAAKTTAAADLKALIAEVEAAYNANNVVVEVGEGIITSTDQFYSEYTDEQEGSLEYLLDGDPTTFWHSTWHHGNDTPMHVHYLQVEFAEPISGAFELNMNRRINQGGLCGNDNPIKMSVETSMDGEEFVLADEFDTPLTQSGQNPLVQAVFNIPSAKYLRFYADDNANGNRGYWHCGDFQLKPVIVPAPNAAHAEAAAAFAEALAAAKAVGANATEADITALQAAYDAYVAALSATPEPTPVTFEFTDNEDGTITITPSDPEAFYFFNIYSDRINTEYQLGTDAEAIAADVAYNLTAPELEAHTGVSVVNPAEWLQYWFGGYVQYTAGDYRLGVVELSYNGTYAMAGEPVFHAFTKAAAVEPEVKSNEFVTEGKLYTLTAVTKAGEEYAWTIENGEVVPVLNGTPAKFVCEFHGDDVAFVTEDGKYLRNHDCTPSTATWYTDKSATGISDEYNELCNLVFEHFPATAANVDAGFGDVTADLVAIKAARGHRTDNGLIADGYFIMASNGTFNGAATTAPFFKDGYTSAFRLVEYVEEVPETFPAAGVAYKAKNNDTGLYIKLTDNNENNVVLSATPGKIYLNEVEGGYTISDEAGNVMGLKKVFETVPNVNSWKWCIANSDEALVWELVEVEGGYAFKGDQGYLGFDSTAEGSYGFRDKNYAEKHGIFTIMKFDDEEEQPEVPDATLEETWANIKTLLAEAETIKTLNEVTLTFDSDGYFEDFVSPIVGKVGYKTHDVVWAVCDGADYVSSFVSFFNTAADAEEYMSEFGGIASLEDILKNVIADYNEAEVVLPEAGKTYIIRNQSGNIYNDAAYSYAFYYNGALSTTKWAGISETPEAKHMWTCAGSSTYTYFNADLDAVSDVRYQFYNAEDNSQYFAWKRVDTDATKADTKWYLTGKNLDGTASPVYGTIAMHTYADNNQYRLLVIDMTNGAQQHANGHCWGNTYSDWYWFEEVEIPVTEWDGNAPVVEVADETTVKVTFTDANSVEGTNYGVLGAIFDESGDVVSVLFDALFDNAVEYDKDSATLHFKKIAELNAELAASAKNVAAKALRAVGGEAKGKVVICGKSFKIDGATIYQDAIVADFSFGGTQTGIDAATLAGQNNIFDLNGRRVREAKNGLFLQNGKKVVK